MQGSVTYCHNNIDSVTAASPVSNFVCRLSLLLHEMPNRDLDGFACACVCVCVCVCVWGDDGCEVYVWLEVVDVCVGEMLGACCVCVCIWYVV